MAAEAKKSMLEKAKKSKRVDIDSAGDKQPKSNGTVPEPSQVFGAGYLYHYSIKYQNFFAQFQDAGGVADIYEVLGVQYNPEPESLRRFSGQLRKPITLHSFEYALGNVERPAQETLDRIQTLASNCQAAYIGEHMAFMGLRDYYAGGFMQPPGTDEQTQVMIDNLIEAKNNSSCPIIVENPSQFVNQYGPNSIGRQLRELSLGAEVGILLSLSNIGISEDFHAQDREAFLAEIPLIRVRQIHILCGNAEELEMPGMESTRAEHEWALEMLKQLAKEPECRPASVIFELESGTPSLAEPERLRDYLDMARDLFFSEGVAAS